MQKISRVVLGCLILTGILLSSCAAGSGSATLTPSTMVDGTLRPYPSDTPTATPLPTGYRSATPSPTITPTATQVFYNVQEGDDMYSIAWRFNLSPAEIMTANPTVNPRAMGVGLSLFIPLTPMPGVTPTATVALSPTATPLYSNLNQPDCYSDSLGGLWCFALVENDGEEALENISGVITIQAGDESWTEVAILPLNLLPAGRSLPLIAYFQPPVPQDYSISVRVDFLLPVMPDDQRYLAVEIENHQVDLSEDARTARVSGELVLPEGQSGTRTIWVNATAFDDSGRVVAVRRWDSEDQLTPGGRVPFAMWLYSLAGPIDRVDVLVEARRADPPPEE